MPSPGPVPCVGGAPCPNTLGSRRPRIPARCLRAALLEAEPHQQPSPSSTDSGGEGYQATARAIKHSRLCSITGEKDHLLTCHGVHLLVPSTVLQELLAASPGWELLQRSPVRAGAWHVVPVPSSPGDTAASPPVLQRGRAPLLARRFNWFTGEKAEELQQTSLLM